jgi:DNA replication protein DnaC
MEKLEPNPPAIRTLRDAELERLRLTHPGSLYGLDNCVTCRGKKTFRWISQQSSEPVDFECDCREQYILSRYLLNAGIDLDYQKLGWMDATHVENNASVLVSEYIEHAEGFMRSGYGLFLFGSKGSGKTLLATLLLKMLLGKGFDGYFTTFPSMIEYHTEGWRDQAVKLWFEQRIVNAGLLVIDDVGRELKNSSASLDVIEAMFDRVIRARVSGCRPTILTTNFDIKDFTTKYRGNVVSLLSGHNDFYEFVGNDFRREVQAERVKNEAKAGLTRPVVLW